ncbi:MAG TPA: hypothetical protein VLV54_16555 [Thermoanaerobaculia bacterium]|nr:hypothetical protein [Thermoanaerobaculia bacterium]
MSGLARGERGCAEPSTSRRPLRDSAQPPRCWRAAAQAVAEEETLTVAFVHKFADYLRRERREGGV